MLQLYSGSGSGEIDLQGPALPDNQWQRLRSSIVKLLRHKGSFESADKLESVPFTVEAATNSFGDDFCVLLATVGFEDYAQLGEQIGDRNSEHTYRLIANATTDLLPSGYIRFIAVRLNTDDMPNAVESPDLSILSSTVERALEDADKLIASGQGATSALDRVHTALHGYLNVLCREAGIAVDPGEKMTSVFKKFREQHPKLLYDGPRSNEVGMVFKGAATIIEAVNTLRNNASVAHPNEEVMPQAEAMFLINLIRSLLHFIEMKVRE
ncbi:abortive infection family protein [Collimonas fungivorans]|uniref:abortive infection family protein n=1 Tax=Collimonas fungivorans TaxID=158899 RepID=UPI0009ED158B|nr:abortive infection family protein [Collimonas fungivorans]